MNSRMTRAQKILDGMEKRGSITPTGKAAVIAALDPFHDERIPDLEGWPDLKVDPSVVRTVKRSITLEPLEEGGAIMVSTLPLINPLPFYLGTRAKYGNNYIDTFAAGLPMPAIGGTYVQLYKKSEADNGQMFNVTPGSGTTFNLAPDNDYLTSECRVIGWAFEVHNVTPELYRGGTVSVAEIPQPALETSSWILGGNMLGLGSLETSFEGIWMHGHPISLSELMLTPGARQWDAAKGVYAVVPFQGRDNSATFPQYVQPLLGYKADSDAVGIGTPPPNTTELGVGAFQYLNKGISAVSSSNRFAPFNSKIALFTGLPEATKLTINVIYYIETFPGVKNPLVTLASPSAEFDPVALEMISHGTRKLPVAVPVSMNGLGDWFAEVVSDIAPIASGIATLTGNPWAVPMISGAGALASTYRNRSKENMRLAPPTSGKAPVLNPQLKPAVEKKTEVKKNNNNNNNKNKIKNK